VLLSLSNDLPEGSSDAHYCRFQDERVLERLRMLDALVRHKGLEALEPSAEPLIGLGMETDSRGRVVRSGYGAFGLAWEAAQNPEWADRIVEEVDGIRREIRESQKTPVRFGIWVGMGGSADDKTMYNAAGLLKRGPRCYVLDSTDPAKLKAIFEDIEKRHDLPITSVLRSMLVVGVAIERNSYEPVVNLDRLAALYEKFHVGTRPNFMYMAAPGSLLDDFGRERGYRKVELQLDGGNSLTDRTSGPLSRGSLYPLALAKADLRAWIKGAVLSDEDICHAWRLAAFIHAQCEAKRDKLTLMLPKPWTGAGIWTKQDLEGSLGERADIGIKVVVATKPRLANYRSPRDPLQDRAILAVQVKGLPGPDVQKMALLRRSGYPMAVATFPQGAQLSSYMQFIHYVSFGLSYLRGVNFVSRPAVESYRSLAQSIYTEARNAGGIQHTGAWREMMASPRRMRCGPLAVHFERVCAAEFASADGDPARLYAAIVRKLAVERRIEFGNLAFFGDTRYSRQGLAVFKSLERAAEALFRARLKIPADVCEGPAMSHSYQETIAGYGKCFSTVLLSEKQEQYAAARYSADYHVAQFLATQAVLAGRRQHVVAITLRDLEPESLEALDDFFRRAAGFIKRI
jgi:hypothetical protein